MFKSTAKNTTHFFQLRSVTKPLIIPQHAYSTCTYISFNHGHICKIKRVYYPVQSVSYYVIVFHSGVEWIVRALNPSFIGLTCAWWFLHHVCRLRAHIISCIVHPPKLMSMKSSPITVTCTCISVIVTGVCMKSKLNMSKLNYR